MWIKNSTAAVLVFATTIAFAAAQDYQIVRVASVAGATIDGLKPKTIFFTDHRADETSDKGAFIRFEEWSRSRPSEAKLLNLFPGFKEGMVHKVIDGTRKEVKDELQMYVTEARFMLSRPAASADLKTFAKLPFIQSIDPSIKHDAIKASDVSTLKDEKGQNNKNPDRAWCEGTGVTACIRSSYKLEGKLPIGVALANKLRDSERKLSDSIEFESEMRLLSASDVDEEGLKRLTGVNTPVAAHITGTMAATERPCARKPAAPNSAAKNAAAAKCRLIEPSSARAPIPGIGPPATTARSGLARIAHSAKTMKTNTAAAATAPVADSARHATANVAATSSVNTIIAGSA